MEEHVARGPEVVIVGAGPAGLTAAYRLDQAAIRSIVLEKDGIVGGISRTESYKGFHFDIGGHRFFTKVKPVEAMWKEVLGDEFLRRARKSRIVYRGTFFHYPLRPLDALRGLGLVESFLIGLSYARVKVFPIYDERTFEDWVCNRFGRRLYQTFFKTYTEKVWGIPCTEISAEWAAQRIKGLSVKTAIKNALMGGNTRYRGEVVKTLVDAFDYPKRGPGMMWEEVARRVSAGHSQIRMNSGVERIGWSPGAVDWVEIRTDRGVERVRGTHFLSTMPVRELVQALEPPAPEHVREAAAQLSYRDFLTVALIVNAKDLFQDNWIYVHDDSVKVGRIQNFKNWSPYMVPDPEVTCLGLEYFCFEGDDLWDMEDADLLALGKKEVEKLGLARADQVTDGRVVRMPKAYPVYDGQYTSALAVVREFVSELPNLQLIGRNGMHKYNNQDHSMYTAMLAVQNIQGAKHDLWSVNADDSYHEEVRASDEVTGQEIEDLASTQPQVPARAAPTAALEEVAIRSFLARMDKLALAASMGLVAGANVAVLLFLAMLGGAGDPAAVLALVGRYVPAVGAGFAGALAAVGYAAFWGFVMGWLIAYMRNLYLGLYVGWTLRKAEARRLADVLTYI